jgi:hypothetical protein
MKPFNVNAALRAAVIATMTASSAPSSAGGARRAIPARTRGKENYDQNHSRGVGRRVHGKRRVC